LSQVRIGGSTEKGAHIKEHDYYTPAGEFRVDADGSPTMLNCLMYKLCYYRFGQVYTEGGKKGIKYIPYLVTKAQGYTPTNHGFFKDMILHP